MPGVAATNSYEVVIGDGLILILADGLLRASADPGPLLNCDEWRAFWVGWGGGGVGVGLGAGQRGGGGVPLVRWEDPRPRGGGVKTVAVKTLQATGEWQFDEAEGELGH